MKARSVREAEERQAQAEVREAGRRVIPIENPILPPEVEILHALVWFALHVAPGQERSVRRELERAGIVTYLPVALRWTITRRIKRGIESSLLTRYLFVGLDPWEQASDAVWSAIMNTPGVSAVLGSIGAPRPVPRVNLIELAGRQSMGEFDQTLGPVFQAEDKVVVEHNGLFAGQRGAVQALVPAHTPADRGVALVMEVFGGQAVVHVPLARLRLLS